MDRQYKHLSALAQLNYSLPCWLCRGRFANLPISYVRDGRVGLALSPHVAEQFKSWNLIASLEKLPLLLRCYGSRWVLCQFLCLTHRSQYQRSTHTWDAFYLLLPANHLLLEIRGKIILNKFDEKLKTWIYAPHTSLGHPLSKTFCGTVEKTWTFDSRPSSLSTFHPSP